MTPSRETSHSAFARLVDLAQLSRLLESHHQLSGMAYGLFDADENNLIAIGWQEICTRYHRVHPLSNARCRESDAIIKQQLEGGGIDVFEYRCKNGMIDVAMPVLIDGSHLATFFTGQFFYADDPPDPEFFRRQARELGFRPQEYLHSLQQVPVLPRQQVRGNLTFLCNMVRNMAEMGLKKLHLGAALEKHRFLKTELNHSRDFLANIINAIADPVFVKNAEHRFILANTALCTLAGCSREELLGNTDAVLRSGATVEPRHELDDLVLNTGVRRSYEESITGADGCSRTLVSHKSRYIDPRGNPFVVGVMRDISERKQIEESLRAKQEQLSAMQAELSRAEERERLRVASVLHDHIGQLLLLSRIKLGALAGCELPQTARKAIDETRELLDQAARDTHSLTVQLNPPVLGVAGLEAALEWLGNQMESDFGLKVEFSDDLQPKPLSDELCAVIYQGARELLINTAKHAGTDRAQLRVERHEEMYRLVVTDRGVGFDPAIIGLSTENNWRFGLFSVQIKMERLGGRISIQSTPGRGARIELSLPLAQSKSARGGCDGD